MKALSVGSEKTDSAAKPSPSSSPAFDSSHRSSTASPIATPGRADRPLRACEKMPYGRFWIGNWLPSAPGTHEEVYVIVASSAMSI